MREHEGRVAARAGRTAAATVTVSPVGRVKRGQIDLLDGVEHKPRQVLGGQPLTPANLTCVEAFGGVTV